MAKTKRVKKIKYIDPGAIPVYLGFCDNAEAFNAEMKRLGVEDAPRLEHGAAALTCTLRAKRPKASHCTTIIICFPKWKRWDTASLASMCAHEASHAADSCFEAMGEDSPGEETRAYLIGYITQHLIDYLKS